MLRWAVDPSSSSNNNQAIITSIFVILRYTEVGAQLNKIWFSPGWTPEEQVSSEDEGSCKRMTPITQ